MSAMQQGLRTAQTSFPCPLASKSTGTRQPIPTTCSEDSPNRSCRHCCSRQRRYHGAFHRFCSSFGSRCSKCWPSWEHGLSNRIRAQNNIHLSIDYLSILPINEEEPISVFWLGTGLGISYNSTLADDCYAPVWQAAINATTNTEHTAILILLDQFCSIGVYGQYLQAIGVTRLIYYTDD
jgi:hypothetical protein